MLRTKRPVSAGLTQYRVLNLVVAEVERRGTPTLSSARMAEIEAVFPSFEAFLLAAFRRWTREVESRLDWADTECGPIYSDHAVRALCAKTSTRNRAVVSLLDHHAGDPALAGAVRRYQARMAGVLGFTPPLDLFPGGVALSAEQSA